MASVRAAKAAAIDAMSFSAAPQPGVTGAALLASFALDGGACRSLTSSSTKERNDPRDQDPDRHAGRHRP